MVYLYVAPAPRVMVKCVITFALRSFIQNLGVTSVLYNGGGYVGPPGFAHMRWVLDLIGFATTLICSRRMLSCSITLYTNLTEVDDRTRVTLNFNMCPNGPLIHGRFLWLIMEHGLTSKK